MLRLRYRLVLQDRPLSDHGLSPEFLSYRSGSYDRCCKIPSHFLALYRLRLLLILRLLYAEMPQSLPEIQTPYSRQNNGFLKFFLVSHRLHLLLHRSRSYGRLPEFLFHPSKKQPVPKKVSRATPVQTAKKQKQKNFR